MNLKSADETALVSGRGQVAEDGVIVYCSCPNQATAAKVALLLQRHGFTRVRPLLGGIDAWREQNYPVVVTATLQAGTATSPETALSQLGRQMHALPNPNETVRQE